MYSIALVGEGNIEQIIWIVLICKFIYAHTCVHTQCMFIFQITFLHADTHIYSGPH